jgi:hypothetical protein
MKAAKDGADVIFGKDLLVANLGTDNLDGEPLRAAVAAGIARVAYTIARGVLLILIIVIFRTPSRGRIGLRGANSGKVPSP